ncbi:phage tail spike protein [Jeotgalibacillus proteolyticus]|uniref:Peptidase S74 domain-containing protein n=1 Tax=Jeotgalibacillus proteolyticus TaxID=2082395 RepID=A0A2S5GG53_9BACL|nr:phage tail spike protein [Jeotgalibacillus proteolyticus]PPA71901.1 hypothetical protein C4B60_00550 [Jeotgalibacillus proteolyticus]
MSELYIFNQDDKIITTLTESTGLISTWFKDHLNLVPDEPFIFTVEADTEEAKHVVEENQVVFRDKEGDFRLFVIKELDDSDREEGPMTIATCEPAFMELKEHIVVDRRFVDQTAQTVLNAALQGTRWSGEVEADLGRETTNFYYVSAVDSVWKTHEIWGGDIKDVVEFDGNEITARKIKLLQRLGVDRGHRFDIDHNIDEIQRTVLSYPVTALYGRGASLPIEDDEGNETGGFTRYIDFAEVEWKKSNGDPVDKPRGQQWVGDPEALQKYGRKNEGKLLPREAIFSNQDYEDPAQLLSATWDQLQVSKDPEVHYRLSVHLLETIAGYEHEKVSLGDTSQAIDRNFSRPIEIQSRVIGLEYDVLDIEGTAVAEMGQFLSVHDYDDRLERVIGTINDNRGKWEQDKKVNLDSYPDIPPAMPANVVVVGGFQVIQLYWELNTELYFRHYEVYASRVSGFVPDAQHLIYKGTLNALAHPVETDEVWYYRIRAVNFHGRPSEFTQEYQGSSIRVISEDILFGPDIAAELRKLGDIVADGSLSINKFKNETLEAIQETARQYTDAEIRETENAFNRELADKAGINYVDGQFDLANSNLQNRVSEINQDLAKRAGLSYVNGRFDLIDSDLNKALGDINLITGDLSGLDTRVAVLQDTAVNLQTRVGNSESALAAAGGRITSIETDINTIEGTLAVTIDQLANVDGVLSSQQTQINANAQAITIKADQEEVDTLTGTVSVLGSELSVQAGLIGAKAEASELITVDNRVTGVRNDLSSLQVRADGISANVSTLRTDFDGLEFGGRNFILNSTFSKHRENWGFGMTAQFIDNMINGLPGVVLSRQSFTGDSRAFLSQTRSLHLQVGEKYTYSGWFYIDSDIPLDVINSSFFIRTYAEGTSGTFIDFINQQVNLSNYDYDKWYFFERTGVIPEGFEGTSDVRFALGRNGKIRLSGLKFEKGSKATDWSQAHEDVDDSINAVQFFASGIEQKADSIALNVTSLSQTVNGHAASITNAQTSITQLNSSITNKAERSEVTTVDGRVTGVRNDLSVLQVSVNGISSSVTSLTNDFNGLEFGGRNYYTGTTKDFRSVTFSGWDNYFSYVNIGEETPFKTGDKVTGRMFLKPQNHPVTIHLEFRNETTYIKQSFGNYITAGYEGYSIVTTDIPTGATRMRLSIRHNSGSTTTNTVQYKEMKLERGNKPTDWTPSPEDTDAAISTVQSFASSVDQKANSIQSSVTSLIQTVNGHSSSISSAQSSITQLNGSITAKAEQSQVDTIEGKVSSVQSDLASLTVGVNGISTSVSALRNDFDGLEIGGRNLAPNSTGNYGLGSGLTGWRTINTGGILSVEEGLNGNKSLSRSITAGSGGLYTPFGTVAGGQKYTVSFWVKVEKSASVSHLLKFRTALGVESNPIPALSRTISPDKWVLFVTTFLVPEDIVLAATTPRLSAGADAYPIRMWITQYKMERGEKATDWTPAPEDIENRFSSTETSINQLSTEIGLRARQTTVDSLTGRMSDAESTLLIQADQISSRVTRNGIVSAINQTPESIKINAGLIDLIGDVFINNGRAVISNLAVGTAAIANGAITNAKLGTAIIGEAQIQTGAITNAKIANAAIDSAKIASVDAVKINSGLITGTEIRTASTQNYLFLRNQTLDFINGNLVKMRIGFMDENNNVAAEPYLTMGAGNSVGRDKMHIEKQTGYFSMIYTPGNSGQSSLRMSNEGNAELQARNDLYLGGGRIIARTQIISNDGSDYYINGSGGLTTTLAARPLIAGGLRSSGTNLYLATGVGQTGEVRATDANGYAAGGTIYYVPMRARSFPTSTSLRENKRDIEVFKEDALSVIKNAKTYLYRIKDDPTGYLQLGLMVDETPRTMHGEAGDSIEMYALGSYLWRGQQQAAYKLDEHEYEINMLKMENQLLKARIKKLENAAA